MALTLVANNDERSVYLSRLRRAVLWRDSMGRMPAHLADCLLQADLQHIERDLEQLIHQPR